MLVDSARHDRERTRNVRGRRGVYERDGSQRMIGRLAATAVTAGISAVGLGAIVAPRASSGQYGLDVDDRFALAYVRALGARDLVFGLIGARYLARRENDALAAVMCIGSLVAVGDFGSVLWARGPGRHLVVHAIGFAGMLAAWALMQGETRA